VTHGDLVELQPAEPGHDRLPEETAVADRRRGPVRGHKQSLERADDELLERDGLRRGRWARDGGLLQRAGLRSESHQAPRLGVSSPHGLNGGVALAARSSPVSVRVSEINDQSGLSAPHHAAHAGDIFRAHVEPLGGLAREALRILPTKLAEHGGMNTGDRHVLMVVNGPRVPVRVEYTPVETTQVAPRILALLGLNPHELTAVQIEGTQVVPGLR
jgi:hypothetical protein